MCSKNRNLPEILVLIKRIAASEDENALNEYNLGCIYLHNYVYSGKRDEIFICIAFLVMHF